MKTILFLVSTIFASLFTIDSVAAENHADAIVSKILSCVAKVKAADPNAIPMAFWDFDGTIIKGDITTGWIDEKEAYSGLFRACVEAGFSGILHTSADVDSFLYDTYPKMKALSRYIAWPALGQIFAGADEAALEAFCRRHTESTLRPWVFSSSETILRALEKAGVENYIISGSPDIFVKGACECAGVPRSRAVGLRQRISGGRLSMQLEYPLSMNEGKIETIREIVNAKSHAYAVAAFGNSYWTDGPFMRYVATHPLPGGASGVSIMINGGATPVEYKGLFELVVQSDTVGGGAMPK